MASSPESSGAASASPGRRTRLQEKEELQHLNDRFLGYIEQVRRLKDDKLKLELELEVQKDKGTKDLDNLKAIYETELADARNLIDETAKDKAQQQMLANKHGIRVDELEAEVKSLKEKMENLELVLSTTERTIASMESQRNTAVSEKNKLQKLVRELEEERDELQATVDALKENVEQGTLSKVDLQNNIQSLKEELSFRKKVHDEETAALEEKLRNREQDGDGFAFHSLSQLDGDAIEKLRIRSDMELEQHKKDLESIYSEKINQLENRSIRDIETITRLNGEVKKLTRAVSESGNQLTKLQKMVDELEEHLRLKEDELNRLRQRHVDELEKLREDQNALQQRFDAKTHEYEQLMGVKVQLDQEIETYRTLLQEEENRLNITPTPRKRVHGALSQEKDSVKRPRISADPDTSISSQATGFIQISDVDPTGKYVQIKNMSDQLESLGGFRINHVVEDGDGEEMEFRFHYRSRLQGQASVTVWAADVEGATHNPPTDIIWKSLDSWGSGAKTTTKLVNSSGKVVATFSQCSEPLETLPLSSSEMVVEPSCSSASTSSPLPSQSLERQSLQQVGDEHMFHQKGDPTFEKADKCIVS